MHNKEYTGLHKQTPQQNLFKRASLQISHSPYQTALQKSGYSGKLTFNEQQKQNGEHKKRQRSRNITWFNPPFSENVSTNLGRKFFNLLDRCFPPGHKLHKLLNRNTVKLSYCCMPNVKQIITAHNRSILRKAEPRKPDEKTCNCKVKLDCPLQGKNCLATHQYNLPSICNPPWQFT